MLSCTKGNHAISMYRMWFALNVIISISFLTTTDKMAYTNDVLYFVDINHKRSSEEKIIYVGKGLFTESAIIEAKQYLLNGCASELSKLDKKISDEVNVCESYLKPDLE